MSDKFHDVQETCGAGQYNELNPDQPLAHGPAGGDFLPPGEHRARMIDEMKRRNRPGDRLCLAAIELDESYPTMTEERRKVIRILVEQLEDVISGHRQKGG
jgi:hypothetical protein